ncbi:MAG: transglutaminaseTgpA domain-containing protein [Gaiellaceae bacterium]
MGRSLVASLLPALVICASWLRLEHPRQALEAVAVAVLALCPLLLPAGRRRTMAAVAGGVGAAWIAFGAQPWELLPYRDERVLAPVAAAVGRGITDFYAVLLPFEPARNPEMHALVVCGAFAFILATGLLVSARRPVGAAAVTVAGAGWPATLVSGQTLAIGALALAAALSIPLVLRARSTPALIAGFATATILVGGATVASSATTIARESVLNWEAWDIRGATQQATSVRFAWDSNYDGLRFPDQKTVVLRIEGPEEPRYWRASTLELFTDDRWFEQLDWLGKVEGDSRPLPSGRLLPPRALRPANWLEQRVEVEALVDDHVVAAGTPVALDGPRLGPVFQLSGGVLRARDPVGAGKSYRVWSYAPDPAPAALSAAGPRYPTVALRFLEVDTRHFPVFGAPSRERIVEALFADPSYVAFARHRPMYALARRVAGDARSPYAAVLALESWFRQSGGFRYDESPPRVKHAPLVAFVTRTRAGYCQHFAGAMAAMLRMLGIPARVAVGFTSGTRDDDGKWIVTDHEAHAWVEVWFRGLGWVPFDPTPGRGTFGGRYSYASNSEEAVAALRRGELTGSLPTRDRPLPDSADLGSSTGVEGPPPSLFAIALLLGALWALGVGIGKSGIRRARYATRDPRRSATASRRELEGFLRDQGVAIAPGTTLQALQRAVHEELGLDGRPFTNAAGRARFGPPGQAQAGASRARKELRSLLRSARRELSVWARARGFVSLRSLRGGVAG